MRQILLFATLVVINGLVYTLMTRPAIRERVRLEQELEDREALVEAGKRQAAQWAQLQRVVVRARAVLDPWQSPAEGDFSILRSAILDAERGLALSRSAVEFRPENEVASGFRGVRVDATEKGDFFSLWVFLDRVSKLNAPLAPVEMTLVEEIGGAGLARLTATWVGLWPEERSR